MVVEFPFPSIRYELTVKVLLFCGADLERSLFLHLMNCKTRTARSSSSSVSVASGNTTTTADLIDEKAFPNHFVKDLLNLIEENSGIQSLIRPEHKLVTLLVKDIGKFVPRGHQLCCRVQVKVLRWQAE